MSCSGSVTPAARVEALIGAVALGRPHLDEDHVAAAARVIEKVEGRLRHGTRHSVVALAGPTGAGKSTLFNALCGDHISATGVRRPTTGVAHAAVWGTGAEPLLDWLAIPRRHYISDDAGASHAGGNAASRLDGLVLIDLPDFDSTEADHRVEVDRLVELVDLLVWVTDPQKYADESLHAGYLAPLANHGHLMRFVLNKIDTLPPEDAELVAGDLEARLVADGIEAPRVVPVSATDGTGVPELREMLEGTVGARRAAVARIEADLATAAVHLSSEGRSKGLGSGDERRLVTALEHAAGVDTVAALVAAQHRRDAADAMGWPPLRWLRRRRRHPIADLPRPSATASSSAEVAAALRDTGEAAGAGLAPPWPAALRRVALGQRDDVVRALTSVAAGQRTGRTRPRWWSVVSALQRVLLAAVGVGLGWLLLVAVLGGFLRLDTDPLLIDTPGLDWIPVPSLLVLGGAGLGFVLGGLSRLLARAGARTRARRVRVALRHQVTQVAADHVLEPLRSTLQDRAEIERLLAIASGR